MILGDAIMEVLRCWDEFQKDDEAYTDLKLAIQDLREAVAATVTKAAS